MCFRVKTGDSGKIFFWSKTYIKNPLSGFRVFFFVVKCSTKMAPKSFNLSIAKVFFRFKGCLEVVMSSFVEHC